MYLQSLGNSCVFASELKLGDLVIFAMEVRCNDTVTAQQQVALSLCSAQHQRQALGINNGLIFGATVVHQTLTIYFSIWRKETVVSILLYLLTNEIESTYILLGHSLS